MDKKKESEKDAEELVYYPFVGVNGMSRKQNVKRNLIFNIIRFTTQMLLQFFLRTIMIYVLGAEYLGLNGLFSNIFTFLNLAELGIGSAIVFNMYKPIAEGDTEKVKALQNLYKKFYLIISLVVLSLGLLLMPFIKYLINGDVSVDINIYVLYVLYLANTLLGYFSAHKRSLLFAHQRNDVENKVSTICMFGMTIVQIAVLILTKNYYVFYTTTLIFTFIESVLIRVYANKLFPDINGKAELLDAETKAQVRKNVMALSMDKIGSAIVFSTDNVLISAMLGLVVLGAYSNYYLIISMLVTAISMVSNSICGSVGDLVAGESKEYVYSKFKQINFIFAIISAFSTICLIVLFQPFIKLWTGGGAYLLDFSTAVLLSISFYLTRMRNSVGMFRNAAGLFWQNRFAPIFEALINLVASIVLGLFMGVNGIVFGTILSSLLVPVWVEPKILYKHYFKKSVWDYFKTYIRDIVIMLLVGVICFIVCSFIPEGGLLLLIVRFAVCVPLCAGLLIVAYIPTKEFKEIWGIVKSWVKNLFNKKKNVKDNDLIEK